MGPIQVLSKGQSGPGSNDNEIVLHIAQISKTWGSASNAI